METENDRIRIARKALKKTQSEFANSLGMTQPSLSEIEKGSGFSYSTFKKIVTTHNISSDWLIFGGGEMFGRSKSENNTWVKAEIEKLKMMINDLESKAGFL